MDDAEPEVIEQLAVIIICRKIRFVEEDGEADRSTQGRVMSNIQLSQDGHYT